MSYSTSFKYLHKILIRFIVERQNDYELYVLNALARDHSALKRLGLRVSLGNFKHSVQKTISGNSKSFSSLFKSSLRKRKEMLQSDYGEKSILLSLEMNTDAL